MVRAATLVALLTALGWGVALPRSGLAGEPTRPVSDRALKKDLRERAETLWEASKEGYFVHCRRCKGGGTLPVYEMVEKPVGRRGETRRVRVKVGDETCPDCGGLAYSVNNSLLRVLFETLRSPAYRKLNPWKPNRERFRSVERDSRRPAVLAAYELMYNIRKTELVDKTHGITWVKPRLQKRHGVRWIRVEDDTKRGTWYLWDRRADGPWPGEVDEDAEAGPGDEDEDVTKPLGAAALEAVRARLKPLVLAHELTGAETRARQLILVFRAKPKSPLDAENPASFVTRDAVAVTRAVMTGKDEWSGLECVWQRRFRDKFGQVEWKPGMTSAIGKEILAKVVWKNLTTKEAKDLFTWTKHEYEGWVRWK